MDEEDDDEEEDEEEVSFLNFKIHNLYILRSQRKKSRSHIENKSRNKIQVMTQKMNKNWTKQEVPQAIPISARAQQARKLRDEQDKYNPQSNKQMKKQQKKDKKKEKKSGNVGEAYDFSTDFYGEDGGSDLDLDDWE